MALTPLMRLIVEKILLPRVGTREQSERETDTIDENYIAKKGTHYELKTSQTPRTV